MGCTNCSSKTDATGTPRGCGNKGNCGTDSCNKLSVFDWLSNMQYPSDHSPFDVVEIRFKNGRKDFFRNTEKLTLSIGDVVATEASPGHDVGIVTLTGQLVKVQMKKKKVDWNGQLPKVYRKASQRDIDVWTEARNREDAIQKRAREIAIQLNLEMKISDVEFQGDGSKATFYYTAQERVDFRQLIKEYAHEFGIRVEMKQIGFRQEASRLGGIGSCGRELCCSSWLTDFRSVNTSAARYQQLSLNPQKLAGQCGKLKCCLNFELDSYLDALKDMPRSDAKIKTAKGDAVCQKIDIFKQLMWFSYTENHSTWIKMKAEQVQEIIEKNKKGEVIASLEDFEVEDVVIEEHKETEKTTDVLLAEDSLNRFDRQQKSKSNNRRRKPQQKKTKEAANKNQDKQQQPANKRRNPNNSRRNGNKRRNGKPNNNKEE
ncbi:MAG TPA: regulatory iron-sulfur-containing complex subunit RicT [Flavobacterium sp.]|nr:regulatory iron-sulfur-containing complex subunit RicT [Flavobacterium sp.]